MGSKHSWLDVSRAQVAELQRTSRSNKVSHMASLLVSTILHARTCSTSISEQSAASTPPLAKHPIFDKDGDSRSMWLVEISKRPPGFGH